MSMKAAPFNGVAPVRLMWSRIRATVPGAHVGFKPPEPLVRTRVVAPQAAMVRTPWTTGVTPRPS